MIHMIVHVFPPWLEIWKLHCSEGGARDLAPDCFEASITEVYPKLFCFSIMLDMPHHPTSRWNACKAIVWEPGHGFGGKVPRTPFSLALRSQKVWWFRFLYFLRCFQFAASNTLFYFTSIPAGWIAAHYHYVTSVCLKDTDPFLFTSCTSYACYGSWKALCRRFHPSVLKV